MFSACFYFILTNILLSPQQLERVEPPNVELLSAPPGGENRIIKLSMAKDLTKDNYVQAYWKTKESKGHESWAPLSILPVLWNLLAHGINRIKAVLYGEPDIPDLPVMECRSPDCLAHRTRSPGARKTLEEKCLENYLSHYSDRKKLNILSFADGGLFQTMIIIMGILLEGIIEEIDVHIIDCIDVDQLFKALKYPEELEHPQALNCVKEFPEVVRLPTYLDQERKCFEALQTSEGLNYFVRSINFCNVNVFVYSDTHGFLDYHLSYGGEGLKGIDMAIASDFLDDLAAARCVCEDLYMLLSCLPPKSTYVSLTPKKAFYHDFSDGVLWEVTTLRRNKSESPVSSISNQLFMKWINMKKIFYNQGFSGLYDPIFEDAWNELKRTASCLFDCPRVSNNKESETSDSFFYNDIFKSTLPADDPGQE